MKSRKELGFTLIELLVVVAILVVLVALLVPALASAKRISKLSICATNVKTVALAAVSYGGENNGLLVNPAVSSATTTILGIPTATYWNYQSQKIGTVTTYTVTGGYLGNYLLTPEALICPETADYLPSLTYAKYGHYPCAYAMCAQVLFPAAPSYKFARLIGQITSPVESACVADGFYMGAWQTNNTFGGVIGLNYGWPSTLTYNSAATGTLSDVFQGRHSGNTGNVGFWDGHVEAVKWYARPLVSYPTGAFGIQAGEYDAINQVNIGGLYPTGSAPDFSTVVDNASYVALCKSTLDNYFWANK